MSKPISKYFIGTICLLLILIVILFPSAAYSQNRLSLAFNELNDMRKEISGLLQDFNPKLYQDSDSEYAVWVLLDATHALSLLDNSAALFFLSATARAISAEAKNKQMKETIFLNYADTVDNMAVNPTINANIETLTKLSNSLSFTRYIKNERLANATEQLRTITRDATRVMKKHGK